MISTELERLAPRLHCYRCRAADMHVEDDRVVCGSCGAAYSLTLDPVVLDPQDTPHQTHAFAAPPKPTSRVRRSIHEWHLRRKGALATRIPALPYSRLPEIRSAVAGRVATLDVGGGKGSWRTTLELPGEYVVADTELWPRASLDPLVAYVRTGGGDLPFVDGAFDSALLLEVLEHTPEPARLLREVARVLMPEGVVVLATPQAWRTHAAPHDYFRYTRYGLEHLLEGAELRLVASWPLGGPACVIAAVLENNVALLRKPIASQLLTQQLWLTAAWLDRTAFKSSVEGPEPETCGWLVVAERSAA